MYRPRVPLQSKTGTTTVRGTRMEYLGPHESTAQKMGKYNVAETTGGTVLSTASPHRGLKRHSYWGQPPLTLGTISPHIEGLTLTLGT